MHQSIPGVPKPPIWQLKLPPPLPFRPGWGDMDTPAIDLFTNTVTIMNLLDLRSIIGCLGGTCSVFMHAFQAKRELHCIFLRKRQSLLHPNMAQRSFFPIAIFL